MLSLVTPRVEVLAELTWLGEELVDPPVGAVVGEELDGVEAPHAAVPTRTAPTIASDRIRVKRSWRAT
jgi:hypothetical protein